MKIAVIAANGRSGKQFVDVAREAGHEINAGIRGVNNLAPDDHVHIFQCDATNHEEVSTLIKGCDAVVSLLGHVKGSPAFVQTEAIKNIIQCMYETDIERLISLTGTGVLRPEDKITTLDRLLTLGISIIDPKRVKDGIEHANVIEKSGLDWSILRVSKLSNSEPGRFTLTAHGPAKKLVARREVALAILHMLENQTFIHQLPIISP